ncbi:MAG: hypothetical protein AAF541_16090 [Pseudomonadota bacterium]
MGESELDRDFAPRRQNPRKVVSLDEMVTGGERTVIIIHSIQPRS